MERMGKKEMKKRTYTCKLDFIGLRERSYTKWEDRLLEFLTEGKGWSAQKQINKINIYKQIQINRQMI